MLVFLLKFRVIYRALDIDAHQLLLLSFIFDHAFDVTLAQATFQVEVEGLSLVHGGLANVISRPFSLIFVHSSDVARRDL